MINEMGDFSVKEKDILKLIKRLDDHYMSELERLPTEEELDAFQQFIIKHDMKGAEWFFHPETCNYKDCLRRLNPDDVVFDVGAGDLRFDLLMARVVKRVYAVEVNPTLVSDALKIIGYDLPRNLVVICANAFDLTLPEDVTVVTCLMIHREHDFPESWKRDGVRFITYEAEHPRDWF